MGIGLVFQTTDTDTCEEITDGSYVIDVAAINPDDAAVLDTCDHYGVLSDQGRAIVRAIGVPVSELWAAYKWRETLRRDGVLEQIEDYVVSLYDDMGIDPDGDRVEIDPTRTVTEIDNAARDWARVNRESDYNYGSPSRWYPDAVRAGVITESELDRAREYYGDRYCYTGD